MIAFKLLLLIFANVAIVAASLKCVPAPGKCENRCDLFNRDFEVYKSNYDHLYAEIEHEIETNAFFYASGEGGFVTDDTKDWLSAYQNLNSSSVDDSFKLVEKFWDVDYRELEKLLYEIKSYTDRNCQQCMSNDSYLLEEQALYNLRLVVLSNFLRVEKMFYDYKTFKEQLEKVLTIPIIASLMDAARQNEDLKVESITEEEWEVALFEPYMLRELYKFVLFENLKETKMYCEECIDDFKKKLNEYEIYMAVMKIYKYLKKTFEEQNGIETGEQLD